MRSSFGLPSSMTVSATLPAVGWFGLLAPAQTPDAVVTKLNAETVDILKSDLVRERLAQLGAQPEPQTPAQFADFINDDLAKWARVMHDIEAKQQKK